MGREQECKPKFDFPGVNIAEGSRDWVDGYYRLLSEMERENQKCLGKNEPLAYPELGVLGMVDLYRPDGEGSWLHRFGENPEISQTILKSIAQDGMYPQGLLAAARGRGQHKIIRRRQKQKQYKDIWRGIKVFTKGIALLGLWGDNASIKEYCLSVAATFGFWGLVDRATADPGERLLAQGALIAVALQRTFRLPEQRKKVDPEKVVALSLGRMAVDEQNVSAVNDWIAYFTEVLNQGIPFGEIYGIIKKRRFQSPLQTSVEVAGQRIIMRIRQELKDLGESPGRTLQRITPEAEKAEILEKRKKRRELAKSVIGLLGQ